jgi:hypothetical protein
VLPRLAPELVAFARKALALESLSFVAAVRRLRSLDPRPVTARRTIRDLGETILKKHLEAAAPFRVELTPEAEDRARCVLVLRPRGAVDVEKEIHMDRIVTI